MKKVLLVVLALVCVLGLTACDAILNGGEVRDISFVLTFDNLDGTQTFTITTTGNEEIILPDPPVREGFTFKGWYLDRDTWQKQLTSETFLINPIYTDRSVYAKWEVKEDDSQLDLTYHIIFETNGGTAVATRDTNRIPSSPLTTRTGYTFEGWFLYSTFSYQIAFPYVPDNDVTLYAKWKADDIVIDLTEYTVSFAKGDSAGGEITGEVPVSQKVVKNRELLLPANTLTKADHNFIGWSDGTSIYAAGEAYAVTADVTLTARWMIRVAPPSYALSFGPGDGEGIVGSAPATANYLVHEVITLPANPYTRNGYLFTGWFDASANETFQAQAEFTTKGKNTTLVAKWQIIEYPVVYNNMDGAVNAASNPATYTIITPAFTIADPTMAGYSFEGWYEDANFQILAHTTITKGGMGQRTFFARWKRIELSKLLNASGNYIITGYTSNSNEITVPEKIDGITVSEIAAGAFRNCTTLTTLIIPNTVTRIGGGIVNGCHNLTNLTLPFIGETLTGSPSRSSVLGYLFGEVPLTEPGAVIQNYADIPSVGFAINSKLKNVTLTSATSVPRAAFQNIASLQTVKLNSYVYSVGQAAFSGCSALQEVDFGAQFAVTSLGANAFYGCTSLTEFAVPSTVATVGSGCFANSGIVSLIIPMSVNELGSGIIADTPIVSLTVPYIGKSRFYTTDAEGVLGYFFGGSTSGVSQYLSDTATAVYNIPDTLTTLSITYATRLMYGALSNCTGITSLTVSSTLSAISSYALYNTGIQSVALPSGLGSIGEHAFANSGNLSSVSIPSTVITLGSGAFQNCTALTEVIFSSGSQVTTLPSYIFRGCTALNSLFLHDGIRVFGDYAFQGCSSLPRVNIASNTSTIGAYAFADCTSLYSGRPDGINKIIIPASVVSIGAHAFRNCSAIKQLDISGGALTTIGDYAFADCTGIGTTSTGLFKTTIDIPSNVTSIGNYAFYNCSNVARLNLNEATSKLETIGEYAFANWSTLGRNLEGEVTFDTLQIPGSVVSIGAHAFENALNLRQIGLESTKLTTIGDYAFAYCPLFGQDGSGATNENYELSIPNTVTTIGKFAFAGTLASLNKVCKITFTQDSSLITIGEYAFAYCSEITEIYIGKNVSIIGEGALRGTARLNDIKVSVDNMNFTSISGSLFNRIGFTSTLLIKYATGKTETEYIVPSGTIEIGSYAFESDAKLTKITLPSTVGIIRKNAFEGSSADLIFKNPTISTIGSYAFAGYLGTSITLPESLTTLADYAFANTLFTSIDIPDNVTTIGSYVFSNSPVTEITLSASVTNIGSGAFANCPALVAVDVNEENAVFVSENGVLYGVTGEGRTLIQYPSAKTAGAFVVPDEVTEIRPNAFEGALNLTTLTVKQTVTSISAGAFAGLDSLASLVLPFVGLSASNPTTLGAMFGEVAAGTEGAIKQGTLYYKLPASLASLTVTDASGIANYAFQNTDLSTITLGSLLSSIGIYAFENCPAAVSFGGALTAITAYAFAGYAGESITIPQAVEAIGEYAFYNSQITGIVFGGTTALQSIGQYAFAGSGLTSLRIPEGVIAIGRSALEGIGNMTDLYIPFVGSDGSDLENTLAYLFGYSTSAFTDAVAQTRRNGVTYYSAIPTIQNIKLTTASSVPVGAFMNVNAATVSLQSVDVIEEYAFRGCSAQVVFGSESDITAISANAFYGYAYNGAFLLPASVTDIAAYAFYGAAISTIEFEAENGLTTIGDSAFAECANLGASSAELALPSPIAIIGGSAFYGTAVKKVVIPQSVINIGHSAFGMCIDLAEIDVDDANSNYKDIGGSLFNKDGTVLIQYPADSGVAAVTLPAGVTSIANYAFAGNTAIVSITIPASVTYIGKYAFAGAEDRPMNLTTVTFAGQSQLSEIDEAAFAFCASLTSFSVPRSVQYIRAEAFTGSASRPMELTSFVFAEGSNIQNIGEKAFAYCSALTSFSMPAGILMVGGGILTGCEALQSLTLPYVGASRNATGKDAILGYVFGEATESTDGTTTQYYSADEYAYYRIPMSLQSVTLTNSTRLTYGTFYGCGTIDSIVLNNDISVIGDYAFYACTSLNSITIPNRVTTIGAYAFGGTGYRPMSIEAVNITSSSNLTQIGEGAFYNCASLTSLYIPQYVSAISSYTLYNSRSLSSITLGAGSRLTSIGDYAFYGSGLESITVPADLRTIGASAFENSTVASFTIDTGTRRLISIGDSAFSGCSGLTSVTIPNSLPANGMGGRVFYNCTALQSVVFEEGGVLADLGEYAFYNCLSMQSITLPVALTAIRDYQFYGCSSLLSVEIPASVTEIGNYAFAGKDGVAMGLTSVAFADASVLQSIGGFVFNLCYSLTRVEIPDSLVSIGEKAFYNCGKLSDLQIGTDSLLEELGDYALSGCASLTSIFIPRFVSFIGTGAFRNTGLRQIDVDTNNTEFMSHEGNLLTNNGLEFIKYASGNIRASYTTPATVKTIRGYAFADAANLEELILPDGLTLIGEYAMSGMTKLASLSIPQTVYSIGTYAFAKASKLVTFVFAGNSELTSLGSYAFFQCVSLVEVMLPSGITAIPDSLFYGCTTLFKVGFGYLTAIGKSSFYSCSELTQIILPLTLQTIGDYAFYNCASLQSAALGESMASLGEGAFSGCSSLTQIVAAANNPVYASAAGVLYTKNFAELLVYPAGKTDAIYIINSRTTRISSYAFLSAQHLKSMSLPSRISYIGYRAFYGASSLVLYCQTTSKPSGWDANWNTSCPVYWGASVNNYGVNFQFIVDADGNATITRYMGTATTFTFPEYVETIDSELDIPVIGIGSGAMLGIDFVTSVLILDNITHIGARAFDDNAKLTIYCQAATPKTGWNAGWNTDSRPVYWSVNAINSDGDFEYIVESSANVTITRYVGSSTTPVIPNMIEGVYVTKIGANAFSASNITGITLPENLNTIEAYAFAYCDSLVSIALTPKVKSIGNFAFAYCTNLAIADIAPSFGVLSSIGWSVFAGCVRLEQIVIPVSVSAVGGQVFKDCGNDIVIILKHELPSGEPTAVPSGYNINWNLKEYVNGVAVYYGFVWQRV